MPEQDPDAVTLLELQHRLVERLFAQVLEGSAGEDTFEDAFEDAFHDLIDALMIHTKIEEEIFYPAMAEADDRAPILHAAAEHLAVKRTLADVIDIDYINERWIPTMRALQEQVAAHILEEEREIFPRARQVFDQDVLLGLGQEMIALAAELDASDPCEMLQTDIDAPARI